MSANGIAHLATREARQKAKLDLAAAKRQADVANRDNPVNADTRSTYDLTELPTQYSGDNVIGIALPFSTNSFFKAERSHSKSNELLNLICFSKRKSDGLKVWFISSYIYL